MGVNPDYLLDNNTKFQLLRLQCVFRSAGGAGTPLPAASWTGEPTWSLLAGMLHVLFFVPPELFLSFPTCLHLSHVLFYYSFVVKATGWRCCWTLGQWTGVFPGHREVGHTVLTVTADNFSV